MTGPNETDCPSQSLIETQSIIIDKRSSPLESFLSQSTVTVSNSTPPVSNSTLGDPEPESVVLSWLNPINLGSPVFTLFNVFIYTTTEGISNITRQVTPNNTIDTDYNNTVTINGLKPNIQYTVTITTISYVEQIVFSTSSRGK